MGVLLEDLLFLLLLLLLWCEVLEVVLDLVLDECVGAVLSDDVGGNIDVSVGGGDVGVKVDVGLDLQCLELGKQLSQ